MLLHHFVVLEASYRCCKLPSFSRNHHSSRSHLVFTLNVSGREISGRLTLEVEEDPIDIGV